MTATPQSLPQRSFVRSVAGTYATQLVLLPLMLGASILQARLVGPEGRGQISLLTATSGVAVLYLGFGLSSSLTYHVASQRLDPRTLPGPLAWLLLAQASALAAVLGVLSATGLAPYILGSVPLEFAVPVLFALFTLAQVNSWMAALLSARRDFGYTNLLSLGVVLVPLSAYGAGLRLGVPIPPAHYAICALLAAEVARALGLGVRLARNERGASAPGGPSASLRVVASYSLLAYACDAIQFLAYRFDVWLVRNCHGDAELGRYSLAVTLGELVWVLATAIATVLFPHIPGLDPRRAAQIAIRIAAIALAATATLSAVGYLLAIPLLPILFSQAFAPSVPLLGVLLLGMVPFSVSKVLGNVVAGLGALRLNLISAIVGMVVCIGLDLLLIPPWGARGAAIATSIAYVAFTVTLVLLFRQRTGMSWAEVWHSATNRVV